MGNPVLTLARLLYGQDAYLDVRPYAGKCGAFVHRDGATSTYTYVTADTREKACAKLVTRLRNRAAKVIPQIQAAAEASRGVGW